MIKKITLYILLFTGLTSSIAQTGYRDDEYNGFSNRSFMKFNSFMTVPTFSVLHRDYQTVEAMTRNSNIVFEDASRLHILSYSGKMRDQVGAGIAFFQQEVGAFKDFGAIANYAYQVKLNDINKLTFGFNFFYSRRSLNHPDLLSQQFDTAVDNYQDKPVVVLQPAATVSFGNLDVGLFLENLADFNLKESDFVTSFADKTISAHVGYTNEFDNFSGLLKDTKLRFLGIARRSKPDGFSYAGNVLADLPYAGWVKVGYDNLFGLNAGFGINLSEKLSIGFSYEKQDNLGGTNEVGLLYTIGAKKRKALPEEVSEKETIIEKDGKPRIKVIIPDEEIKTEIKPEIEEIKTRVESANPQYNDLTDEIKVAQDSINILNKKIDEVLRLLKNQPKQVEIIREVPTPQPQSQAVEEIDRTLRRRTDTPWRESTITRTGGGAGTMYYVAVDAFKDLSKAQDLVKTFKKKKVNAKYVRDPRLDKYFVYIDRFSKEEEAEEMMHDINGTGNKFENNEENELGLNIKKVTSDRVYVAKITLGGEGETYSEPKEQPKARVSTMRMMDGLEPGYYLQVSVNGQKAYADKFLDELRSDGIDANYFINPKTGYRHVYILKTDNREEAIRMYNNNLDGTYYDRKNIIHIR